MTEKSTAYLNTQFGVLRITSIDGKVTNIAHCSEAETGVSAVKDKVSKEVQSVIAELKTYFLISQKVKSLNLRPQGTAFQQRVWQELVKIPSGETRTYGQIAQTLKSSARAVGNACRKNPLQILIPCHRVISAKGIGGFAGKTNGDKIRFKRNLLQHEGCFID